MKLGILKKIYIKNITAINNILKTLGIKTDIYIFIYFN